MAGQQAQTNTRSFRVRCRVASPQVIPDKKKSRRLFSSLGCIPSRTVTVIPPVTGSPDGTGKASVTPLRGFSMRAQNITQAKKKALAMGAGPLIGVLLSFFSGAEAQHHHNGEREQDSGNGNNKCQCERHAPPFSANDAAGA